MFLQLWRKMQKTKTESSRFTDHIISKYGQTKGLNIYNHIKKKI